MKKHINAKQKTLCSNEIKKEKDHKNDRYTNEPVLSVDDQVIILARIIADVIINEINNYNE